MVLLDHWHLCLLVAQLVQEDHSIQYHHSIPCRLVVPVDQALPQDQDHLPDLEVQCYPYHLLHRENLSRRGFRQVHYHLLDRGVRQILYLLLDLASPEDQYRQWIQWLLGLRLRRGALLGLVVRQALRVLMYLWHPGLRWVRLGRLAPVVLKRK